MFYVNAYSLAQPGFMGVTHVHITNSHSMGRYGAVEASAYVHTPCCVRMPSERYSFKVSTENCGVFGVTSNKNKNKVAISWSKRINTLS